MKLISYFSFLLIFASSIHFGCAQAIEQKLQVSLSTGYQREALHWSIAGNSNGQSPNILSELKWKNVAGQDYSAALQWNFWRRVSMIAAYDREDVRAGSVNDMDYNGDNRTDPVYTGNFNDNKGYTTAWSAGAGYIIFNNKIFSLIPFIGYGTNTQSSYLVDLTGQFPGLNSSYAAHWNGGFIKLKSSIKVWHALKFAADGTYNQVNYTGQGDWNLINEFQHPVSYRHNAKGYGINANMRLVYSLAHNIMIAIGYSYFNRETGTGNDFLYLASGQTDKTRLNEVVQNEFQLFGGVTFSL